MKNKIKKLKIQLSAAIFLLVALIVGEAVLFFYPTCSFAQYVNDYGKSLPATLNVSEWNNLVVDFLAKSGDTMTGILNMGGNRIINVPTPTITSPGTDVANKQYVDDVLGAIGGSSSGHVFVNWGRTDCPTGTTEIYDGVAFSAHWNSFSGGDNPVCIDQAGTAGAASLSVNADQLYPLVTSSFTGGDLPSAINGNRIVRCAVCIRDLGTCYESFGNSTCSASGFSTVYSGYVLGAISSNSNNTDTPNNSTQRACVNSNFDDSLVAGDTGAVWTGTRISDNFGLGYTENAFLTCALCCN